MSSFDWSALDSLNSRGSKATKVVRMADLHQKRGETLSQFFTPSWVVKLAWSLVSRAFDTNDHYRLLDNSVGAASMFRFADPTRHTLHGFDIDKELIANITEKLDDAGFECDLQAMGMEEAILGEYSAALINPPFSITLSSPHLTPYEGITCYGKHGPDTSALSHEYALAQALEKADLVAAVLPNNTTKRLQAGTLGQSLKQRLVAVLKLPASTFVQENVESVSTDLLVFGNRQTICRTVYEKTIKQSDTLTPLPDLGLMCRSERELGARPLRALHIGHSKPAVTLPVTQDRRVILTRAGRNIALRFFDAATEVKVKNALWRQRLRSNTLHRYPSKTNFAGQYQLSLDAIVLQADPFAALKEVVQTIAAAGGLPEVTRQLRDGLRSLIKEHQQMTVPYGRTVYRKGTPSFSATARNMGMIDRSQPRSVVAMGEEVKALRVEDGFEITTSRGVFTMPHDDFFGRFDIEESAAQAGYWQDVYPPIRDSYPQRIAQLENRAIELGLNKWLSWDFQMEDLLELAFRPKGGVCGWQMALGKTRLILALSLLLPGPSLIVVKARLVDELQRELTTLGLGCEYHQCITGTASLDALTKINIVSYEAIRRPLDTRWPKVTMAKRMKKRFKNIFCDEGGLLSNSHTQQSQAINMLGGVRRYVFDGTPMANYPRDLLPVVAWCVGAERSYQPYSAQSGGGYMYPELFNSAKEQPTGRQAFFDRFVTIKWATNEFNDTGVGAKREIPKIPSASLPMFRQWLSPLVKRRVQQEPAVAKNVTFPVPVIHPPENIEWDIDHLSTYVRTVEDFADWYRKYYADQSEQGKSLNLTIILQRLEACFKATNAPHTLSGVVDPYKSTTSKQVRCIELVIREVEAGRRPVVFARNPSVLDRLHKMLTDRGISSLVFTGREPIKKRTKRLNDQIRDGHTQVMLASLGVTQDGLNLPELNTFIFYNRSFKSREEFQAIYRLLRALQKAEVHGYFLHLAGSLDDYMGQLVEWKELASESGLDYGEGVDDDTEFVHFDAILQRFINTVPDLKARLEALRNNLPTAVAA